VTTTVQERSELPGRLIVAEGTDGSGKSTAISLLESWLIAEGYHVYRTSWNSSPFVKPLMRQFKKKEWLGPAAFSLLHASDFYDRYNRMILPRLQAGYIVLADRWVYTAWVRDSLRGLDLAWIQSLYKNVCAPHLAIYFSVPPDVAIARLKHSSRQLKYYESGQDISGLHDRWASFLWFQEKMRLAYLSLAEQHVLQLFDGTKSITEQQKILRQWLQPVLEAQTASSSFFQGSPPISKTLLKGGL
jgi:dTMP kinase